MFLIYSQYAAHGAAAKPMLSILDGTQSVTLLHHQDDTATEIPAALIRRYRHRRYSQVVDTTVPVNYAHWYFSVPSSPHPHPLPEGDGTAHPLPGDEIYEPNGTVWTILEVNLSPLTEVWQAVCETFAFAEPTEHVDHLRQSSTVAELMPVRVGVMTETFEPEVIKRLTFYVREAIAVEPDDVFRRMDDTLWKIVRVERPQYRSRWTAVFTTKSGER